MLRPAKILIFSPSVCGGIAEHTAYQATALLKRGAEVICLTSPSFLDGRKTDFKKLVCLPDPANGPVGILKRLRMAWQIIASQYILAWQSIRYRPDLVLLDSYMEYLAPFWIDPHILLSRIFGIRYAANLHDPVRSFAVGPKWWHKLSVWLAYQPLGCVFVHHELPDRSIVPARVTILVTPHGLYDVNLSICDHQIVRNEWGVLPGQKVFLSFGYVRDGKNIDLAIRALKHVPQAVLVIVGSVASTKDKPFQYYRDLAAEVGVEERCRFFEGFISDKELGRYFSAADFVLLTYSAAFHSQSGVLNIAVKARKPILASASPSPMLDVVAKYHLGLAVEPDSVDAIAEGMGKLLRQPPVPHWNEYEKAATWDENARVILESLKT